MSRKKTAAYIAVLAMIIAAGIMMPHAIRWTSGFVSGQIKRLLGHESESEDSLFQKTGKDYETEPEAAEKQTESEWDSPGSKDTEMGDAEADSVNKSDSASPSSQPFTYEDLAAYHNENKPQVTGSDEDYYAFIWDREEEFTDAVLNYLFAWYRDSYRVDEIRLVKVGTEGNGILVCEMELSLIQGENSGYTKLLCNYDTNEDVYTIRPYSAKE